MKIYMIMNLPMDQIQNRQYFYCFHFQQERPIIQRIHVQCTTENTTKLLHVMVSTSKQSGSPTM